MGKKFDIELLAPAGDMDSLAAAVENGADAVYLGGRNFSARQYAGNFGDEEMKRAVEYCHTRGVRVFVTVNILLKDSELFDIPKYAIYLYNIGVDALIIQDIGVGRLIRDILPDFELHASTQMTAHNLDAVNLLWDMGYKRVVLSRELSLMEIRRIASNTRAEIEIFCHGALCICYSGQCLMSSMIGGRSGNRGRCAQPCRMKYSLRYGENKSVDGYLLSPKDLNTIEHIGPIIESGARSLKVEGRMKRPEYVASVISIYRKAIDSYREEGSAAVTEEDKKDLLRIFNRGGFTTAHLFGKNRGEMMSIEKPKNWGIYLGSIEEIYPKEGRMKIRLKDRLCVGDGIEVWTGDGENRGYAVDIIINGKEKVQSASEGDTIITAYKGGKKGDRVYKTSDVQLVSRLKRTYKSKDPLRKIPISGKIILKRGIQARLCMKDTEGHTFTAVGSVPEEAIRVALSVDRLKEQISKLGGTPFILKNMDVEMDENLSMPLSAINSLRRDGVEGLIRDRIESSKPVYVDAEDLLGRNASIISKTKIQSKGTAVVSVSLKDSSKVNAALKGGADIIIFGGDTIRGHDFNYSEAIKMCNDVKVKLYIASPRIIRNEYNEIIEMIDDAMSAGAYGIYADNLGILKYASDKKIPFAAGFSLNIMNRKTSEVFEGLGSEFISISPELSLKEISVIAPFIKNCEAYCYGRMEMMISEYCPAGGAVKGGCIQKDGKRVCRSGNIALTDRLGMEFPIKTDAYCRSHIYNSKILSMIEESGSMSESGIDILRVNILDESEDDVYNIVSAVKAYSKPWGKAKFDGSILDKIKDSGYTKGHYFRGVE